MGWWLVFCPVYVFVCVVVVRFAGSLLARMWVKDMVKSNFMHSSAASLLAGILSEQKLHESLAESIVQKPFINACTTLASSVLNSAEVHSAAGKALANTLRNPDVLAAAADATEELLQ